MRIAFFGTPDFAIASLKAIHENGHNIVGVFTAPDKPAGRGQKIRFSEVKNYALENELPIFQPPRLKNKEFLQSFRELKVDLAVVVAFRMMPEALWSQPTIGTFNLHGSLLPQYRGAAPINWAIMNGEKETGVTTFFINHEIDKGSILMQEKCTIQDEDNFGTMYYKLKTLGAELVLKTIKGIKNENLKAMPQVFSKNDNLAPKITPKVLQINDFTSCEAIHNKIRGLRPVYKPFFTHNNKKFIIHEGNYELCSHSEKTSSIISDNKSTISIVTNDGYYHITKIQAEGKKPMDVVSFLNGYKWE